MKLFITRHGETDMNLAHRICGNSNGQLTAKGLAQAQQLADRLEATQQTNRIEYIYVSPLERAIRTARPIEEALGLTATVEPRLAEINFGKMEGTSFTDPLFQRLRREYFSNYPGGESQVQVAQRLYNLIDDIKVRHNGHNVLFVCHGTVARIMRTYFLDMPLEAYNAYHMQNCEVVSFDL
ncbi:MAG: histidine phosphatase family protein [Spirochaetia bacterium]|nr:histidine phosphatase family protein [Spirochaetia bacterium]